MARDLPRFSVSAQFADESPRSDMSRAAAADSLRARPNFGRHVATRDAVKKPEVPAGARRLARDRWRSTRAKRIRRRDFSRRRPEGTKRVTLQTDVQSRRNGEVAPPRPHAPPNSRIFAGEFREKRRNSFFGAEREGGRETTTPCGWVFSPFIALILAR